MNEKERISASISKFLSGVVLIIIFILIILFSDKLPGASTIIFTYLEQSLTVYHLLYLIFIGAIIFVLFNIKSSAQTLMYHLLNKNGIRTHESVTLFSNSLINIIYTFVIYVILLALSRKVIEIFPSLNYIITILTVALAVVLMILLFSFAKGLELYLSPNRVSIVEDWKNQEAKNTVKCPNCGYENPVVSKFCVSCGAKLQEISEEKIELPQEGESKIKCPNCGYLNSSDSKFCVNCGTPLVQPNKEDSSESK
jgi:DNA-directed RNA polymerase subunit RPC12/RpoP